MTDEELARWVTDTLAGAGKEAAKHGGEVAMLASRLALMPDENCKKAALSMYMAAQACNAAVLSMAEAMQSMMPRNDLYKSVQEVVAIQNATIKEGMAYIREVRI